ncbi:acylneuraminate cytidylyltransferase family protein, partial [bacterium]|nr:acylneuraminate cytidylyltransferase family protein [bacterium]
MPIDQQKTLDVRRVAIIPARGGSKRLPRKNILPLGGRPMVCWSVEAALQSGLFERVCVSTDDQEIAQIASQAGAEVLRRPDSLGSDSATVAEVCSHHMQSWAACGKTYDYLFCLYPTAPLRNAKDLRAIASILDNMSDALAVIGVSKFMHYPHQALRVGKNGELQPFWPELVNLRGSDLPTLVAGNGSTYAIQVKSFMQTKNFLPA